VAFIPLAKYTARAAAAGRRNWCELLGVEGVAWSAQRVLTAVNIYFLGWVNPVPDPLLLRKSGSAGNRTRDLWTSSQEL
jgi:hypothetical protein